MADPQRFDLLILGGGMSYVGAIRAAQLGLNVGLVERDKIGGTCLNRGCIPSKALLETADLLHRVQEQGAEFGLSGNEGVGLDYGALGTRRDAVVDKHVSGVEFLLKKNKVTVLRGSGTLTGPTSVRVSGGESGDVEASADNLILATGSAPRSLPGLDPDGRLIITSDEALTRGDVPGRVAIVGAGAIGVEWASMYRDFGAEVTLVEFADRIVPLEDAEVGKELARVFRKRGITSHVASTIDTETLKKGENEVTFQIAEQRRVEAHGPGGRRHPRRGRTAAADREHRPRGDRGRRGRSRLRQGRRVHADRRAEPVRDRRHRARLRPRPRRQPRGRRRRRAPRRPRPGAGANGPHATGHLLPAADRIGRLDRGRRRGPPGTRRRPGSFPFRALGKATIVGEVDGFAKLVTDAGSGELLGAHIIGPHAGDLLAEPTFARLVEGTAAEIAMSVHAHPTLTEVLAEAALAVDGAAIHV